MTAPSRQTRPVATPNDATVTRPERSSKRVAHRSPLGWLPWLLLGLLALVTALTFLVINAVDDDGAEGPAGDSLGQVSGSEGSGINGEDESNGDQQGADSANDQGGTDGGQASGGTGDLAGLTSASLVGGAGVKPAAASADAATAGKREAGTAGTVLFAESSAELDANAQQVIARAVESLKAVGAKSVTVAGFTDVVAGEQVNDPLSQDRADAVAGALKAALPGVRITTQARGQESPVASNADEAGRQQNRRASIVATG